VDLRLDKVIRVYWWGHQACSLFIRDGHFYMIRTGVLGGVANDRTLHAGAATFTNANPLEEKVAETAVKPLNRVIYWIADKRLKKGEERLSKEPLNTLAANWMSASVPLSEITETSISMARQYRVTHEIPQLDVGTTKGTFTLRFPQTPMAEVEHWAALLRNRPA
jgi:hypothetical protein